MSPMSGCLRASARFLCWGTLLSCCALSQGVGVDVQMFGTRTMATGVVRDLPFEARFEEVRASAERGSTVIVEGAIYRDSQGRTRKEVQVHDGEMNLNFISIALPAERMAYVLLPEVKAALRTEAGPPQENSDSGWLFPGTGLAEAGRGVVEGIDCRHFKRAADAPVDTQSVTEVWISDDLETVLLEKAPDPQGERTWRLFDIQRREPAASLFELPAGYTLLPPGQGTEIEVK